MHAPQCSLQHYLQYPGHGSNLNVHQDEQIKMWGMYTMEYYSNTKKNEIAPFAATWMDLEMIKMKWVTQVKPSRTLWGPWAQKPSCVSHSLFVGNRFQPPWPSLSSEGQISTAAHQGRESREKQGRRNQESIVQTRGRSWFYPMGYT